MTAEIMREWQCFYCKQWVSTRYLWHEHALPAKMLGGPVDTTRYTRRQDDPVRTIGGEAMERMMQWFKYDHLKPELQEYSKPFCDLATWIETHIQPGPERTVALRKLLEAKDAAVRAHIEGGLK